MGENSPNLATLLSSLGKIVLKTQVGFKPTRV
jgi:hypothetical protein